MPWSCSLFLTSKEEVSTDAPAFFTAWKLLQRWIPKVREMKSNAYFFLVWKWKPETFRQEHSFPARLKGLLIFKTVRCSVIVIPVWFWLANLFVNVTRNERLIWQFQVLLVQILGDNTLDEDMIYWSNKDFEGGHQSQHDKVDLWSASRRSRKWKNMRGKSCPAD